MRNGDFLLYEQEGNVVTLTMNHPDTRNALTDASQFEEIVDAINRINADMDVRCAILTGAGPSFCAGGNIKRMRDVANSFEISPFEQRQRYKNGIQTVPLAIYRLEVPLIAAINGHAIGAGLDLACTADIRIASEKARFAESYPKLGIIPGFGGTWLLPRLVGMSKASEMSFTGDRIKAEEALACGLVSKVVAPEALMDETRSLADRIAANPPHALRMIKRLMREGQFNRFDTQLEMTAAFQALAHHTLDHREALNAVFEKRDPEFKGQ